MEIRTYFLNEETGNYDEHSSSVSLSEFSYIVHHKAGILDSEVVSEYSGFRKPRLHNTMV